MLSKHFQLTVSFMTCLRFISTNCSFALLFIINWMNEKIIRCQCHSLIHTVPLAVVKHNWSGCFLAKSLQFSAWSCNTDAVGLMKTIFQQLQFNIFWSLQNFTANTSQLFRKRHKSTHSPTSIPIYSLPKQF